MSVPSLNSVYVLCRFTFFLSSNELCVLCSHTCKWHALMSLHGILGPCTLFFCSCEFFCTWQGLRHPDLPWIDAFRFWPTVARNRMPSRWHWSAGKKKSPQWCRMSVPSLNSVHVLCRFTFCYPATNFSFCAVTAVSDMLWCLCTASWDPAHCSFATHHLSHPTLSHTIFHTQLSHTPFTQNFVTTPFSLSRTIFHIPLCHTQLFTYNLFYCKVLLLDPPPPPLSFLPSPSSLQHLLLIIGRSWLEGLSCPLIQYLYNVCYIWYL